MPFDYSRTNDNDLAIAYAHGNLSESDIIASLTFAFGTGQIEPGMDRIVIFDPQAEVYNLDLLALKHIQQRVLDEESRDGHEPRFRAVLVAYDRAHKQIHQLYKAIWDVLEHPGVQFFIADSREAALALLKAKGPADRPRAVAED